MNIKERSVPACLLTEYAISGFRTQFALYNFKFPRASPAVVRYNDSVLPVKGRGIQISRVVGGSRLLVLRSFSEGGCRDRHRRVWEKNMCMLDEIRAKRDEIYAIARRHKAEKFWVLGLLRRSLGVGGCVCGRDVV